MTDFDDAIKIIDEEVKEIEDFETVNMLDSLNRVSAKNVVSNYDFPPFDRSAMDGFAFRYTDVKDLKNPTLLVKEVVLAGHPEEMELQKGECVRIMTGGKVPDSCDTVIEFEKCEENGGRVKLLEMPKKFYNISLKGEDLEKDEVALKKGELIKPKVINLLGSLGMKNIKVKRKLKIAVLSTGDELVDIDEEIGNGKIRNSSKYALASQIKEINQEFVDLGKVNDDEKEIQKAIQRGLEGDIVLVTGGSSVGDKDLTLKILEKMGASVFVKKMAIKPGRPTIIATMKKSGREVLIFGMPGNPVSTFSVFKLFVTRSVEKLLGTSGLLPKILTGTLNFDFEKKRDRMHFVPCKVSNENGKIQIEPLRYNGSGDFTALAKADAFFIAPKEAGKISKESKVKYYFI